ncbi:hypothetical protein [Raoultella ornithinolytica]|uniref:hypothetical protein n=1 Tax=Raoultella ornithinolytica TaxID=54291 RepID=UPI001D0D0300
MGGFKNKVDNCRFDGLFDFFNRIDVDENVNAVSNFEYGSGKIGMNTLIKNKNLHETYAAALVEKCREFVS